MDMKKRPWLARGADRGRMCVSIDVGSGEGECLGLDVGTFAAPPTGEGGDASVRMDVGAFALPP